VVLLILVVLWAAVLGPGFLKRMLERRSGDSIGTFHRNLRVLERATPALTRPARRLAGAQPGLALVRDPLDPGRPARPGPGPGAATAPPPRHVDPYLRPEACKRRRDVLLWLLCALLGTGVLGAIPELRILLAVTAVVAGVMACYLVMLARLRRRAVERSTKLRYLPVPEEFEPSFVIRRRAAR